MGETTVAEDSQTTCACMLAEPPRGNLLDRLARWLEGDSRGAPAAELADLGQVLDPAQLAALDPAVRDFYRTPQAYALRTGVGMGTWSRYLMWLFAALFRQSDAPDRGAGFEAYEVCQQLYTDRTGRVHWDRYARVDGRLRRLFIARIAAGGGRFHETFVIYGLPVRLTFRAEIDGEALRLSLVPLESSPLAWLARVSYRTAPMDDAGGLATEGDFRVPLIGLRVRMQFRMRPVA